MRIVSQPDRGRVQIECRLAQTADFEAIQQMLELYQYDLSDFAPQDLDSSGRYGYDLTRHRAAERSFAYVLCVDGHYGRLV